MAQVGQWPTRSHLTAAAVVTLTKNMSSYWWGDKEHVLHSLVEVLARPELMAAVDRLQHVLTGETKKNPPG